MAPVRFDNPILVSLTSPPEPDLDVLVLPGAGAGPSSFSPWCGVVPPTWRLTAVCLPGRGTRIGQPFITSLPECADQVAAAARAELDRPLVLFGHSMGGLVALEVAMRVPVRAVFTAGTSPVQRTLQTVDMPESMVRDTVREILRTAGVEDSPLQEELLAVAAPILRSDMLMLHGYERPTRQVDCEIVSYYGTGDVVRPVSWAPYTTGPSEVVVYDGDHYAVQTDARWFTADLQRRLSVVAS